MEARNRVEEAESQGERSPGTDFRGTFVGDCGCDTDLEDVLTSPFSLERGTGLLFGKVHGTAEPGTG